jgi:ankyrin repeat protein
MADRELTKALIDAACSTKLARVREILARGVDPNEPGEWGRTALPLAVRYAYNNEADAILIAEALLAAGANINASPGDCLSPIRYAAMHGYMDLLRYLLASGADPTDRDPAGQSIITLLETTPCFKRRRRRVVAILEKVGGMR